MRTYTKFKEYIWLVNTIRRAGKITLAEINEQWVRTEMSEGVELARSTFVRHKNAIEDIFGIFIECDRLNGYRYYIGNEEVLAKESVQNWMLSTISVNNLVSESLSLQERILLQPVKEDAGYLEMVMEAMKKGVRIAVDYRKYGTESAKHLVFEPYCIKMFNQRWYVLGHFHRDATPEKPMKDYFGVFSFDRIMHMELTDIPFNVDPNFDAQAYFAECYGVVAGDGTSAARIVLRAYNLERFYLKDLPMHGSQTVIAEGENYTDFELYMRPTVDFTGALMGSGNQLKVLSPQWLADEIRDMHLEAAEMYQSEEPDIDIY